MAGIVLFFAGFLLADNSVGNIADQTQVFYSLDKRDNDQQIIAARQQCKKLYLFCRLYFYKNKHCRRACLCQK